MKIEWHKKNQCWDENHNQINTRDATSLHSLHISSSDNSIYQEIFQMSKSKGNKIYLHHEGSPISVAENKDCIRLNPWNDKYSNLTNLIREQEETIQSCYIFTKLGTNGCILSSPVGQRDIIKDKISIPCRSDSKKEKLVTYRSSYLVELIDVVLWNRMVQRVTIRNKPVQSRHKVPQNCLARKQKSNKLCVSREQT